MALPFFGPAPYDPYLCRGGWHTLHPKGTCPDCELFREIKIGKVQTERKLAQKLPAETTANISGLVGWHCRGGYRSNYEAQLELLIE